MHVTFQNRPVWLDLAPTGLLVLSAGWLDTDADLSDDELDALQAELASDPKFLTDLAAWRSTP